jgi:hypothetical protein
MLAEREGIMPAKSIVMAFVLSGWLIAAVLAALIVAYTSFFGIAVIGVFILAVSVTLDRERDGAVGAGMTPGFLAQQHKARRELSDAHRQALRDQHAREARSTRYVRYLGVAMMAIGLGGFWLYQL